MNPTIIPQPLKIEVKEGHFTLQDNFKIYLDPKLDLSNIKIFITEHILASTGFHFRETSDHKEAQLCFIYKADFSKEEYELNLTASKLTIHATTGSGHFYGLITFMQLFPTDIFSKNKSTIQKWEAPSVTIKDSPQFSWRGVLLDCSRHFFSISEIKEYMYWMSVHKLNVFHWHLTDDQGWRFESKKYPKLTEIGSYRIENDGTKYGPFFYTQSEMKSIVSYGKTLFITVVPEIEMPGHSCAALAAYPEFSCGINPPETVPNRWGTYLTNYCLGNERTIQFLKDILEEALEIFDSEFVHIGGDEVRPKYWFKCEKCQKVWKDENIKSPLQYQCWFNKIIANFLNEKGRKMIGWDEILEESLPKNNIIMAWNSAETGQEAANMGYKVILTPNQCFYLDYSQFKKNDGHKYMDGLSTLRNVYEFDPFDNIDKMELILGVQANAWSEFINDFIDLQWKVFPRLCAFSEVAWSANDEKDFDVFNEKLKNSHLDRLRKLGINYAHL